MKKFLFVAAIAAMSLVAVSCGGDENAENTENNATQTEQADGAVGKFDFATQKGTTVMIDDYTFDVPETYKMSRQAYSYKSNRHEVTLIDDNGNSITATVDADARVSDNAESDLADRRKYMGTDFSEIKGEVVDGKCFFIKQYKDKQKNGHVRMFKEKNRITIDMYASSYAKVGNEFTPEMMEAVCKSVK